MCLLSGYLLGILLAHQKSPSRSLAPTGGHALAALPTRQLPDAAQGPPSLSFLSPLDGQIISTLPTAAIAPTVFQLTGNAITRVDLVLDNTVILTTLTAPELADTLSLRGLGNHLLGAFGYDKAGHLVAQSEIQVELKLPPLPIGPDLGCLSHLDALGASYSLAIPTEGVQTPVYLHTPIDGVTFHYDLRKERHLILVGEMALTVIRAAKVLHEMNITDVLHMGTYSYRCIYHTGDPGSGCIPSAHSRGLAIDLQWFMTKDKTIYSIERNFQRNRPGVWPCSISELEEPTPQRS